MRTRLLLTGIFCAAAFGGGEAGGETDLRWFADAAPGVAAAVESVVEVTVSHRRKPSRGFRRLPFQPDANPDAEPVVDCASLEPVPRASRRERAASGFDVCGVRVLRWLQAGDPDSPSARRHGGAPPRQASAGADRLELAVAGQRVEQGRRWLEVILDPAGNRRGWLQYAPGRKGVPLMRMKRLADWVTSSRHGTVPAHAARHLALRAGPSEAAEPAGQQLPSEGDDVPVEILGVQGKWVKLSVTGTACERAGGPDAESNPCPAGWTLWRADDGEPRLLP